LLTRVFVCFRFVFFTCVLCFFAFTSMFLSVLYSLWFFVLCVVVFVLLSFYCFVFFSVSCGCFLVCVFCGLCFLLISVVFVCDFC